MRKIFSKTLLFLVIFQFFLIPYFIFASSSDGIDVDLHVGSCNNNGICETGNEDFFVCPADCTPIVVPPDSKGGASGSLVMDNSFNNLTVEVSYTTAIIKWTSFIPTMSNLKWGTNPDYKDGVIRNVEFLLNHRVEIHNLKEGTTYYFNIEAENLLGKTTSLENQVFRTLSLLDTTPPSNPTNVKANSGPSGIIVSWNNPTDEDFDYIRIMKNDDRYYGSPFIGRLVYEGNGTYFVDGNVKDGNKYYYSLFSRDRAGNYSSGALISVFHNPNNKDIWGDDLVTEEKPEPLSNLFIVSQGSLNYDFKIGSVISLSGDSNIKIKTDYSSNIKNDDMWVQIRDSNRRILSQYFFSRVKDKEGFISVDIPLFEKSGYYGVSIYRYDKGNTQLINQGAFQISKTGVEDTTNLWYIFFIIIVFLLIILILYILLSRFRKK